MHRVSAAEICRTVQGRILNEIPGASAREVIRPAPLGQAQADEIGFFFSKDYQAHLRQTQAGIVLTGEAFAEPIFNSALPQLKSTVFVACPDPYLGMAKVTELFAVPAIADIDTEVHPTAVVHPQTKLGPGVQVGALCVLEDGVEIGAGTVLHPQVYLGPGVKVGENSSLFSGVKVYAGVGIGNRVRIHAGTVLGADGFGYAPRMENGKVVQHQKIWHFGTVRIEDDVEIGALCSIDRATFGETVIKKGAKLDNQVHVGHNARVGEGAVLCGGVGLAGTSSVGKFAYLGGHAGLNNKTHVGDYAKVAGMSQIVQDVPENSAWGGYPARDIKEYFRIQTFLYKMYRDYRDRQKRKAP